MSDTGTIIFFKNLGRAPKPGEQIKILDASPQTYTNGTHRRNGTWDTETATLNVDHAAFLKVGPVKVPEPRSMAQAGIGATVLTVGGRSMRRKTD